MMMMSARMNKTGSGGRKILKNIISYRVSHTPSELKRVKKSEKKKTCDSLIAQTDEKVTREDTVSLEKKTRWREKNILF